MSVNPGCGGQRFIDSQLRKIEAIRRMIDKTGKAIDLEVDGGIDRDTAPRAIAAGANVPVAATATFTGGPAASADTIRALTCWCADTRTTPPPTVSSTAGGFTGCGPHMYSPHPAGREFPSLPFPGPPPP